MRQDHGDDITSSDEDEGGVPAKYRGVSELDERANNRRRQRCVGMRKDELVEMMDVCYAEVKRREKDDPGGRERGQEMQRHKEGAEQDFLRYRPCNIIPPADPAAEAFMETLASDPVLPSVFDGCFLEKWAGEEQSCQQQALCYLDSANRVPTEQSKDAKS